MEKSHKRVKTENILILQTKSLKSAIGERDFLTAMKVRGRSYFNDLFIMHIMGKNNKYKFIILVICNAYFHIFMLLRAAVQPKLAWKTNVNLMMMILCYAFSLFVLSTKGNLMQYKQVSIFFKFYT